MNIETLEKRLREIEQVMQQTLANFNMLEGGKAEILYWLGELKKMEHKS
jgi:hypothetical protein